MHTTGTGLVEIQAVAEIPGLNVTAGGNIGCATAVYGQIAVVGACNAVNPDGAVGAGLVHAFHLSSRIPAGLVVPPRPKPGARFGTALTFGEYRGRGILLVGAPGESSGFYSSVGFVYVFSFSLGQDISTGGFDHSYVLRLYAEDGNTNNNFGSSVRRGSPNSSRASRRR